MKKTSKLETVFIRGVIHDWHYAEEVECRLPKVRWARLPVKNESSECVRSHSYRYWTILSGEQAEEYSRGGGLLQGMSRCSDSYRFGEYVIIKTGLFFEPVFELECLECDGEDIIKSTGLYNGCFVTFSKDGVRGIYKMFPSADPFSMNIQWCSRGIEMDDIIFTSSYNTPLARHSNDYRDVLIYEIRDGDQCWNEIKKYATEMKGIHPIFEPITKDNFQERLAYLYRFAKDVMGVIPGDPADVFIKRFIASTAVLQYDDLKAAELCVMNMEKICDRLLSNTSGLVDEYKR